MEEDAFPELYNKRWPIETKYNQVKQKLELENFSGRLVDNIKQDFYGMMTIANIPTGAMKEVNEEIEQEGAGKAKLEGGKKRIPKKATFPSQSPIKLLMGEGGEQAFRCLFSLTF